MSNIITIDGQDYEIVGDEARYMTAMLFKLYEKLGIPEDITEREMNATSWKMVEAIFHAWKVAYPQEYHDWITDLEDELKYERPVKKAIGKGHSPIAYPTRIFSLMKVFFPKLKLNDKAFIKNITHRLPELKHTNYNL